MVNVPQKIRELLDRLKELHAQIMPLRAEVGELQSQLEMVERDYDSRLGPLNQERTRLELEQKTLEAKLGGVTSPPPPPAPPLDPSLPHEPPPPVVTPAFTEEADKLPRQDPRARRKQALADHLLFFVDDDDVAIKLAINKALEDPEQDVGHMLERLEWGDIWKSSAPWESPEEQTERLEGWRGALLERLAFWEGRRHYLETQDKRVGLWREWQARDQDGWFAYLDRQVAQQEAELEDLRQAVALLQRRYHDNQSRAGETW